MPQMHGPAPHQVPCVGIRAAICLEKQKWSDKKYTMSSAHKTQSLHVDKTRSETTWYPCALPENMDHARSHRKLKMLGPCILNKIDDQPHKSNPPLVPFSGQRSTPLHCAAAARETGTVLELLRTETNVDALDDLGRTPLHVAASVGDGAVVRALLAAGADCSIRRGPDRLSPLHEATRPACLEALNELVEHGVDPNEGNWLEWTPLHEAASSNNVDAIEALVKAGADLTAGDQKGYTPLHAAADFGCTQVVRYVLAKGGADIDAIDDRGYSPLLLAVRTGYDNESTVDILQALLDAGCSGINSRNPRNLHTPLHGAAVCGHVGAMMAMIDHGADVAAVHARGHDFTALHFAATSGNPKAIDVLIEAGANPNQTDDRGMNCLHVAACAERAGADVVHAILRHGVSLTARLEVVSGVWVNALHIVAAGAGEGQPTAAGIVDVLLRWGADETATVRGKTALQLVQDSDDREEALRDDLEQVRTLLQNAPKDRAWRRRGLFVILRAFPGRVRSERENCCNPNREMPPRSCSRARLAAGANRGGVGGGMDDWEGVADRLLWLDGGVFRTIIEFL